MVSGRAPMVIKPMITFQRPMLIDSAYQSAVHAEWLSERGIENSSIKRAYRHRPLGKEDKQFNRLPSGARSPVERVFGVLKQH